MNYGWDFCPRLVHQGIMSPVTLNEPAPRAEPARPRSRLDADYRLDGEPVKGWNWVPVDALYGVPRPEKVARLLELATASGANLIRVWGGGLLESDEFYEHCDRLGLAVWQEFSQSSSGMESVPSADPAFVRTLVEDARQIVPRLARHPSLSVWCGGNELDGDDSSPALAALGEVVHELDPERTWLPTSPLGDADLHGPWEHQGLHRHTQVYDGKPCKLHSEFGVEGMTNRAAHEALIAEENRWPADRTNPVYEHLGAWWCNAPLVQESFGGRIRDLETLRRASQWLQYEGLRYAVEARLRQGIGVIPWQLNESYPNAWCTAVVDWHGDPKPAYYGVKRAYLGAPSARFATWAWGGEEEVRVFGTGRIVDLHGNAVAEGDGEIACLLDAIPTDVFLVDLVTNRYVMTKTADFAPLLDLPPARVELRNGSGSGASSATRATSLRSASSPTTSSTSSRVRTPACDRAVTGRSRAGMYRALDRDGAPVDGFAFDGNAVTWTGAEPVEASIRYELEVERGGLARPRRLLRREPSRGVHADLPALHAGARRRRADGVGRVVVPGRPLRDAGGVRRRARSRHARGLAARPGGRRLRAAGRTLDDLARLPLPRGAAPLRRLEHRGAAGRPHARLAAR